MRRLSRLWWWLALLFGAAAAAQDVQPVPPLTGRVIDTAAVLQPDERAQLDAKLATFESRAGPQIVVLLVATTQPEDIAAYAQRIADSWKIGRRDVGDGILVVVARDDRRIRIEVAKALEGAVPDLAARQIIDRAISPAFKRGDYAGGLSAGIDGLIARIQGEGLPAPAAGGSSGRGQPGFDWGELAMFFFIGVPVVGAMLTAMLGRKLGSLATAGGAGALAWVFGASTLVAAVAGAVALLLVGVLGVGSAGRRSGAIGGMPIIWGGGGGSGGRRSGGFGGGGGGFSSGGGGDFGGGGASGNW